MSFPQARKTLELDSSTQMDGLVIFNSFLRLTLTSSWPLKTSMILSMRCFFLNIHYFKSLLNIINCVPPQQLMEECLEITKV